MWLAIYVYAISFSVLSSCSSSGESDVVSNLCLRDFFFSFVPASLTDVLTLDVKSLTDELILEARSTILLPSSQAVSVNVCTVEAAAVFGSTHTLLIFFFFFFFVRFSIVGLCSVCTLLTLSASLVPSATVVFTFFSSCLSSVVVVVVVVVVVSL